LQAIAAGLALHPQLLACAAVKSNEASAQRDLIRLRVHEPKHQNLAGGIVLDNGGD
jgi:hypothetical protein